MRLSGDCEDSGEMTVDTVAGFLAGIESRNCAIEMERLATGEFVAEEGCELMER